MWRRLKKTIPYLISLVYLLPILGFFTWLISISFNKGLPVGLLPDKLTLDNWAFLWRPLREWERLGIWQATINTTLFAMLVIGFQTLGVTMLGYALSRLSLPGKDRFLDLTMLTHAIPGIATLVGTLYIVLTLRLAGNFVGLALVDSAVGLMQAWIMKSFFDAIPHEIEWAAYIDGCSKLKAWLNVLLPLVKPGLAFVVASAFLDGWGEFFLIYLFMPNVKQHTLPVWIRRISEELYVGYGMLAAASIFYILPMLAFFFVTQAGLMKTTITGVRET